MTTYTVWLSENEFKARGVGLQVSQKGPALSQKMEGKLSNWALVVKLRKIESMVKQTHQISFKMADNLLEGYSFPYFCVQNCNF